MELMDCSLQHYLKEGSILPLFKQVNLCQDVSKGLAFLHDNSIIHHDLCDDNILLILTCPQPKAKISDFGMSRLLPEDYVTTTLTSIGHRAVYLPPEASEDPSRYSYTLDIYSFGVVATQIVQSKSHFSKKMTLIWHLKIFLTHTY